MISHIAPIFALVALALANPQITPAPTTTTLTTGTADPCSSTICADYLKTCGTTAVLTYGGCYPACSPAPTFSPPPCPETTSAPSCSSTGTVCRESFRTCGTTAVLTYGGCFDACGPTPTFSPPPCPTATITTA